jgi:hypothetical protein
MGGASWRIRRVAFVHQDVGVWRLYRHLVMLSFGWHWRQWFSGSDGVIVAHGRLQLVSIVEMVYRTR